MLLFELSEAARQSQLRLSFRGARRAEGEIEQRGNLGQCVNIPDKHHYAKSAALVPSSSSFPQTKQST
jgi:hypothetical protein